MNAALGEYVCCDCSFRAPVAVYFCMAVPGQCTSSLKKLKTHGKGNHCWVWRVAAIAQYTDPHWFIRKGEILSHLLLAEQPIHMIGRGHMCCLNMARADLYLYTCHGLCVGLALSFGSAFLLFSAADFAWQQTCNPGCCRAHKLAALTCQQS